MGKKNREHIYKYLPWPRDRQLRKSKKTATAFIFLPWILPSTVRCVTASLMLGDFYSMDPWHWKLVLRAFRRSDMRKMFFCIYKTEIKVFSLYIAEVHKGHVDKVSEGSTVSSCYPPTRQWMLIVPQLINTQLKVKLESQTSDWLLCVFM